MTCPEMTMFRSGPRCAIDQWRLSTLVVKVYFHFKVSNVIKVANLYRIVLFPRVCCFLRCILSLYSSTCHERPPPVRSESGPSWQVAPRGRERELLTSSQKHKYTLHINIAAKVQHSKKTFNYNNMMLTYTCSVTVTVSVNDRIDCHLKHHYIRCKSKVHVDTIGLDSSTTSTCCSNVIISLLLPMALKRNVQTISTQVNMPRIKS